MLVGAAALSSCNSLEVTLPRGPQGEQGIRGISGTDGLSAYELWARAVSEGTIPDWDGGKTTVSDYFIYLKGADGENGKDGKSAYELWKEYISSGDIPSPKDPETPWAADNDSERDFYEFLTGADGDDGLIPSIGDNGNWFIGGIDTGVPATGPEGPAGPAGTSGKDGKDGKDGTNGKDGSNGKSAYEVWKEYIAAGNDSSWPKTLVSEYHYFLYLKGEKGDKGDQGDKGEQGTSGDTPYVGDNGHWHVGNTDTGVPATGDAGADGLSAYQLWKQEVLSENGLANPGNGVFDAEDYPLWPSDAVSLADFWSYLTGKDGKSAYELWKDYISDGTAEDPKNPGSTWDPEADTEADFYYYLTGPDGKDGIDGDDGADGIDGLSAYELWKKDVLSESGLSNPGNGVYDVDEYPLWPTDAVSQEDFWLYLRGRDGKDGLSSSSEENITLEYAEEADADMYNVAPVRALMKIASSTDTTYEYVNPYSGGAAFIVTGPGPVIIPDCEVVFNDVKGNTYSKKSDGNGYVYLSRSELPDYQEGDPSAGTGLKPVSFKFGGRTVTDASKIAATCKVPYKVGISVQMTGSTLMPQNLSYDKMLVRTVEGNEESSWGGVPYPLNSGGNGYFYYRSKSALAVFKEEIGSVQYNESEYTYTADALTASNKRNMELTVNDQNAE